MSRSICPSSHPSSAASVLVVLVAFVAFLAFKTESTKSAHVATPAASSALGVTDTHCTRLVLHTARALYALAIVSTLLARRVYGERTFSIACSIIIDAVLPLKQIELEHHLVLSFHEIFSLLSNLDQLAHQVLFAHVELVGVAHCR